MKRLIISLNSRKKSAVDIQLVGGKAANLLKLNHFGFRTMPGFILSTIVFHQFMRQSNRFTNEELNRFRPSDYTIHRDHILSLPLDLNLEKKVLKHHKRLQGTVAVRSSMVGEDQPGTSFAGQLDTYLHITTKELIESIKKCYASLFNPHLHKYVSEKQESVSGDRPDVFAMAVIIQEMVKAKIAGITFTADPISGRREVITEACEGTAEKLVAGETTPDRYVVNASGKISEIMPQKSDQTLLSQEQILQLAALANEIAQHMGEPQDIEWAWDGENFIFLQTRPISTLKGKNIYSSKLMADMSPGLVKPLQWSTNTLAMANQVFGRLFTELIGSNDIDFSQSIRLIHSRVYANLTFFEKLFQQIGLPLNFFGIIAREERSRRRPPLSSRLVFLLIFRLLPFMVKYSRRIDQMRDFIEKQDVVLDSYRKANWSHHEINQKYESLKKLMLLHNKAQWSIIITALNMMIRNTLVKKMVQRHAPSVEPSNLIKGLAGLKGMEPNKKLDLLSQQLRPLGSDIIQLCVEGNDKKIRHQLNNSPEGQKIINEFDLFMQKFGHLSANTTNFTETPWIENPKMIWKSIGTGASQEKKMPDDNPEMIRSEKREEVLKNLNMVQKPIFLSLLNSTITYLGLREKISLLLSDGTHQFRRLLLSIGDDLVKKGMLEQADDTFFLFSDDLENIIKYNGNIGGFTEMVTKRREQIARDAKIVPEDTICGDQIYTRPQIDSRTSEFLSGICGSSGYKQGYAYVAESPDNVQKSLTADDILVVPYTHVGWTPLFSTIGGIIAETGGQLSHTAIIAREYGIPAIVNVQNVMQLIKTGERLSIDADAGRIYLKHENSLEGEG